MIEECASWHHEGSRGFPRTVPGSQCPTSLGRRQCVSPVAVNSGLFVAFRTLLVGPVSGLRQEWRIGLPLHNSGTVGDKRMLLPLCAEPSAQLRLNEQCLVARNISLASIGLEFQQAPQSFPQSAKENSSGSTTKCQKRMAPQVGLEPTTLRLTAGCSAIELLRSVVSPGRAASGVTSFYFVYNTAVRPQQSLVCLMRFHSCHRLDFRTEEPIFLPWVPSCVVYLLGWMTPFAFGD